MQCLTEKTDAEHSVTTQEIIDYLALQGINAERKSIYTDIDLLIDYGMDIVKNSGRSGGYTLVSRQFELAELKLLVDAVQSSKFITTKKSRDLIGKLETLCSKYEAGQLHRQVVVTNRNKTVNENIYYNVDIIYNAIAENVKIQFQYFEWDVNKEMHLRRNGKVYEVSPWLLTWDDENYYLIAYDSEAGIIKHYRVDKMLKIELSVEKREGKEQFQHFDIAAYSKKTFGMFAGKEETVTLRCDRSLTGVMIDRFGKDVAMRKIDENTIQARVNVAVSRQFFGWITGLGNIVKIKAPDMKERTYQIVLEGIVITVTKKRIKNMYLRIKKEDGMVLISAPYQMSDLRIRRFAEERLPWIREYQEKYKELKQQKDLRPALSEAEIRRRKVLLKAAVEKLIQKYEQLMRVQVSGVTIRQMKTRWGSCNVKTHHININLALYEKGPECLEYVVVHEMCHILEASHNKIFWGYVAQYFPDWKNVRARLNEEGV